MEAFVSQCLFSGVPCFYGAGFETQYRSFKDIQRQAFLIGEDFSRFLIFKRIIQVRYEPFENAMGAE